MYQIDNKMTYDFHSATVDYECQIDWVRTLFVFTPKQGEVDVALGVLTQVVKQGVCTLNGRCQLIVKRLVVHQ